jgi:hypothetical protein
VNAAAITSRSFEVILAASLGLAACGPAPETWVPLHNLVDSALREAAESHPETLVTARPTPFSAEPPSTAAIPTATIADDTRPVLAMHPALAVLRRDIERPDGGVLTLDLPLDRTFPPGARLWIAPAVSAAGLWNDLSPFRAVVRAGSTPLRLELPPIDARAPLQIAIHAHRIPESRKTLYRTPEIAIPPGSRLQLALGVLDAARSQGPVRFTVGACEGDACAPVFDETVDPAAVDPDGWLDRWISLDGLSGRRTLRFETEYLGTGDAGFSLPVWANPRVLVPDTRPLRGPNLLLLSIDTLRADHLGVYGYERATSPFMTEDLAPRSTVFDTYAASATSTDPSHMTMFTSLSPLVHGVTQGLEGLQVPVITLAEVLRAHGLVTAAFTENGPLAHGRGFGLGFDEYTENKSPNIWIPPGQVDRIFEQARRWLEAHGDERFFLFLHTYQVHDPYRPPPQYRDLFASGESPRPTRRTADGGDPRTPRELVADYDREIRYVDDELRSLFEWMRQRGLDDNTLLVVTADHGEQFYEHGLQGHEAPPYQEIAHVPLIFHGPGVPAGRRVSDPTAQIDLMPTLLELTGAPVPARVQGTSFADSVTGAGSRVAGSPRLLYTSGWLGPKPAGSIFLAVRRGHHKLIRTPTRRGDRYQFFDLSLDPGEGRNRFEERRLEARELVELLRRHERDARAVRAALRGGASGAPAELPFDPEREQQLRSLGYVD